MNKLIIRQTSEFVYQISHNQITAFFQIKDIRLYYFLSLSVSMFKSNVLKNVIKSNDNYNNCIMY